MLSGWLVGAALMLIGGIIAMIKPKPGKESLDWLGGLIAGAGTILFLAFFSAWIT